jgi:large repetitive protein
MKNTTLLCALLFLFYTTSNAFADVAAPPANDECGAAAWLTVNTGQSCSATTAASLSTATVSAQANVCTLLNGGDVWYQFTATSTAHTISLSNFATAAQPAVISLYQGDCASLTQLYCSVNNVIIATGLTSGVVYKLRVYYNLTSPNNSSGFTICVTTPPAPSSSNQTNCLVTTINYSFESPPPPAPTTFPVFLNHNAVQGWRTTASDQMMEFWVVPNYENVPSYEGIQFIELNANLVSGVYQDYATPQPTVFNYGFAHRGRQGTDTCQLLAGPPGGPYTSVQTATTGNSAWAYYTGSYTVPAGQSTTRFIFQSVSSVGGVSVGNYLDAITFTANNGILSANPLTMGCGTGTANIAAAGTGVWVPHADNPTAVVIANPSGNNTTITGFGMQGVYHFDWTTAYCVSTLEIFYEGEEPSMPLVANVAYCQGQPAVPLTAEATPGNTINWYPDDGALGPPTPLTTTIGSQTFYVSQTTPDGCESVPSAIVVTVNTATPPVTGFALPATVCNGAGNVSPVTATGFSGGGQFSGGTGLAIDPVTGTIDMATTTPGSYTVTYEITEDLSVCLIGGSSTANITINDTPDVPVVTVTQPTCALLSGTITVDSPAGTGLTYSIDGTNYQSGTEFSGLTGGNYTVYVKGVGGCISQLNNVVVNTVPVIPAVATYNVVQPNCSLATGTITVLTPTGVGYMYSIDGITFQAGTAFTGLAGGTAYTITVQNASGCTSVTGPITLDAAPVVPAVAGVTITQPTCDAPSGVIAVNAPLGAGLTYSIDGTNYQTGTGFSGLVGGNYTVYVKADGVCTSQLNNVTVNTVPVIPAVATYNVVQPNCSSSTGTITVTAPTGTGYTYSIDGITFQTGTAFTGLAGGTAYTITVQNASGCTSVTGPITLDAAPVVPAVAGVTITQPTCAVLSGVITVNAPIGTGLTYSIDGTNYQVGTEFSGLIGGNYTVYVKADAVCTSQLNNVVVNTVPVIPPVATCNVVQPNCSSATGTITVTAPTGTGYTYSIDGITFQVGTVFAGLAENTSYVITVQNASGCTSVTNAMTMNAAPVMPDVASVSTEQPDCDTPQGSITIDGPLDGTFTYSIDGTNYQSGIAFPVVGAGNYTVYVKSATGCISMLNNVVIDASPLTPPIATYAVVQPNCTTATGTITVNAPTGIGYTYSIDGTTFQTGTAFSGLDDDTDHVIIVKNAAGCISSTSAIHINIQPVVPDVADVTIVQPVCDTPVGSITINSPTGLGYTYSINGTSYQTSTQFANLIPANYTVYVKNAGGCVSQLFPATINAAAGPPPVATLDDDHPDCTNSTGTLTVLAPLGSQYTYSIDGVNFQSGTVFTGLTGGFAYSVTVMDPLGCTSITVPVAMSTAPVVPAAPTATVVQPSCGNPGIITVTSPLGTGYSYSLNGTIFQSNPIFTDPPAGSHTLTVKSSGGCRASSGPYTITPGLAGPGAIVLSISQTTCASSIGSITVASPQGAGLTYSIDGTNYDIVNNFPNLTAGSYTIYVKAANGCVASLAATINTQPITPIPALATVTQPGCTTAAGITVTAPLDATYTYSINGTTFQPSPVFANVPAGSYTITVKTGAGCTSVSSPYVVNPAPTIPAMASVSVTQPFCTVTTGTITVNSPTGAGLTYSIGGPFQVSNVFTNVAPGSYVLIVQNTAGCTSNKSVTINPAQALPTVAAVTVDSPECGETKGTLTIDSPTGAGLSYSINGVGFQTGTHFANLAPGNYNVMVKNSNGCTSVATLTIDVPPIGVDPGIITGGSEVCEGETLQLANLVTGGTWASSATTVATISATGLITALTDGVTLITYEVPGTATECPGIASLTFRVNGLPELDIDDAFLCEDLRTGEYGSVYLNTGLSAGYTFEWKKGATVLPDITGSITVSEPDDYTVKATNIATGCVGETTVTVGVSSAPIAIAEVGGDFQNNQTISVTVTGGSGSYEYSLNGGPFQTEPYFNNISQGEYTITIRDINGCGMSQMTVTALNFPHFFSPNGDGERDTWNITGMNSYTTEISIFDRFGKAIAVVKPGNQGWDGTFNGSALPATDYWFVVKYMTNGQNKEFKAHFSLIR